MSSNIRPFIPDELFEINEDYVITSYKDNILIIDDFYKNFEDIYEILTNMAVPIYKTSKNSRNFKDYYDCRPIINSLNVATHREEIEQLCIEFFNVDVKASPYYEFNFYKNIKSDVDNKLQHFPHVDKALSAIIYFDKVSSGGTAFYPNMDHISNNEHENLLYDISHLDKFVIQAKPNRLVLFKGQIFHGGYIEDHDKYLNDWRINQVVYIESKN